MKKEELKKMLGEVEIDDKILEGIIKTMNDTINNAVAKNKPNLEEIETKAVDKAMNKVITELGVDGVKSVDDLKELINKDDNTDEVQKQLNKMSKELEDYKTKFETSVQENQTLQLKGQLGKTINEKYIDFALTKYNTLKTDDNTVEEVLETIVEEYPEFSKDYKEKRGNPLPDDTEKKKTQVDEMASVWKD